MSSIGSTWEHGGRAFGGGPLVAGIGQLAPTNADYPADPTTPVITNLSTYNNLDFIRKYAHGVYRLSGRPGCQSLCLDSKLLGSVGILESRSQTGLPS